MMTSLMPSVAAAALSSWPRTRPRSPPGTSAGSLIDPFSPCEAQSSTTRAPPLAARASVPPQASDSSSGCAKIARIVRPASGRSGEIVVLRAGTVALCVLYQAFVDRDILVDHAVDAEPLDGALPDTAPVEVEDARQLVGHLLEILEHQAGHAVVHDLPHRAAIERGHRCAARHRLGEHQPERLARLD